MLNLENVGRFLLLHLLILYIN